MVLTTHLKILQQWEPFYTQLVICAPHLSKDIRTVIVNIQAGMAFYIEKALINKNIVAKAPLHLILNTWLGLIHYYLCNKDLFSPNQSVMEWLTIY
jgi:hypothetical protein